MIHPELLTYFLYYNYELVKRLAIASEQIAYWKIYPPALLTLLIKHNLIPKQQI